MDAECADAPDPLEANCSVCRHARTSPREASARAPRAAGETLSFSDVATARSRDTSLCVVAAERKENTCATSRRPRRCGAHASLQMQMRGRVRGGTDFFPPESFFFFGITAALFFAPDVRRFFFGVESPTRSSSDESPSSSAVLAAAFSVFKGAKAIAMIAAMACFPSAPSSSSKMTHVGVFPPGMVRLLAALPTACVNTPAVRSSDAFISTTR
mmetsp:Transcript_12448/g.41499  ORF Transcript_12448/g.41499 Transcript_12448/m.41499 type:complete len:214 (+) Transcript_12448:1169-1810(+)